MLLRSFTSSGLDYSMPHIWPVAVAKPDCRRHFRLHLDIASEHALLRIVISDHQTDVQSMPVPQNKHKTGSDFVSPSGSVSRISVFDTGCPSSPGCPAINTFEEKPDLCSACAGARDGVAKTLASESFFPFDFLLPPFFTPVCASAATSLLAGDIVA